MKNSEIEHSIDYLTEIIQSNNDLLNVVCDLDETVFNPLETWKRMLERLLDVSIDLDEVQIAGNLDEYFKHLPHYQDFVHAAEMLRKSPFLYENSTLVCGAGTALAQIAEQIDMSLAGYLSARPVDTLDISLEELQKNNLPIGPIILRSTDVDFYSSSQWKVGVLQKLLDGTSAYIVIVDDNIELVSLLRKSFSGCKRLITILFKGPLSAHAIEQESISTDEKDNFYVGDWSSIPGMLNKIANDLRG